VTRCIQADSSILVLPMVGKSEALDVFELFLCELLSLLQIVSLADLPTVGKC
jgi:hypothetical protein